MEQLTGGDLRHVVTRLPRDLREMLQQQPIFVGGGFIRETIAGGTVNDIDLFGPAQDRLETAASYLQSRREGSRIHKSDNAITLLAHPRLPVQFITRWLFAEAEPLMASFDFTVCQAVIWFDRRPGIWKSCIADTFYSDLAARRLTYTSPKRDEEAGGSMLRVRKFLQRGYNIQALSLAGVIARLVASTVMGTDEQRNTHAISRRLIEVDPLLLIDGFEPVDEHEAINGEA